MDQFLGLINLVQSLSEVFKNFSLPDKEVSKTQGIISELLGEISLLQAKHSAAMQEVADLKQKVIELEGWEVEKQRYELVKPFGSPVFALKEELVNKPEPAHYICPQCYQKGKKSFFKVPQQGHWVKCVTCGYEPGFRM